MRLGGGTGQTEGARPDPRDDPAVDSRSSAASTPIAVPADKLALYEKLVATLLGVEREGATVPYTSLNGHMFSYLGKDGRPALRLPKFPSATRS